MHVSRGSPHEERSSSSGDPGAGDSLQGLEHPPRRVVDAHVPPETAGVLERDHGLLVRAIELDGSLLDGLGQEQDPRAAGLALLQENALGDAAAALDAIATGR